MNFRPTGQLRIVAFTGFLAMSPALPASRAGADSPPPIEKVHPAAGHSVDDLQRQAKEMKEHLALGKSPQDVSRQTQELTRMRTLYGSVCSKSYRAVSAQHERQCVLIKDDLAEANRRLSRHSR